MKVTILLAIMRESKLCKLCEPTDSCTPNPCNNWGTCNRLAYPSYTCDCLVGYDGTTCDTGNVFNFTLKPGARIQIEYIAETMNILIEITY